MYKQWQKTPLKSTKEHRRAIRDFDEENLIAAAGEYETEAAGLQRAEEGDLP